MPPTQHPPPAPRLPLEPTCHAAAAEGSMSALSLLLRWCCEQDLHPAALPATQTAMGRSSSLPPMGGPPLGLLEGCACSAARPGASVSLPQCGPYCKEKVCSLPWCSLTLSHWIPARSRVAAEATF